MKKKQKRKRKKKTGANIISSELYELQTCHKHWPAPVACCVPMSSIRGWRAAFFVIFSHEFDERIVNSKKVHKFSKRPEFKTN